MSDGVIDDPRQCRFDVNTLPITAAQKNALKVIYAPTGNRDGEIYPGQPVGGEGQTAGWPQWITGVKPPAAGQAPSLRFAFGTGIFKYLVFNDPNWDYSKYNLDNWKKDTALAASFLNATNPDLSAFNARGGKLILWHGWADPALTPLASIRYHDQVYARDPKAASYLRTFLMPGVLHCGGGTGPDTVDWTTAIVDWVEKGKAAGARDRDEGGERRGDPQPASLSVSTDSGLQRLGQHRRRTQFRVPMNVECRPGRFRPGIRR